MFDVPPLFKMIQEQSKTEWSEMYKVFNMGHRMEIYVPENIAGDIIEISRTFNIDARVIGYCQKAGKKSLTIKTEMGVFPYSL